MACHSFLGPVSDELGDAAHVVKIFLERCFNTSCFLEGQIIVEDFDDLVENDLLKYVEAC